MKTHKCGCGDPTCYGWPEVVDDTQPNVECPGCGFCYSAEHGQVDGTYSCPECNHGEKPTAPVLTELRTLTELRAIRKLMEGHTKRLAKIDADNEIQRADWALRDDARQETTRRLIDLLAVIAKALAEPEPEPEQEEKEPEAESEPEQEAEAPEDDK